MKINACWRPIQHGEIIHTFYDSDTGVFEGIPSEWFDFSSIIIPEYAARNYENVDAALDEMCERILCSTEQGALVLECNQVRYLLVTYQGNYASYRNSYGAFGEYTPCGDVSYGIFRNIGYRRTKMRQLRAENGIYRLCYNTQDGYCYTQDGKLKLDFDISKLDKPDYHYAGYKDMIANGAYAIIYSEGKQIFLDKVDDHLVPRS